MRRLRLRLPGGVPRSRYYGIPNPHAEFELSTMSMGNTGISHPTDVVGEVLMESYSRSERRTYSRQAWRSTPRKHAQSKTADFANNIPTGLSRPKPGLG